MKFALRSLAKSPGFTAVAVLTIALGIGANTTLFSIFHRLVLSPFDLPEPHRLVRLWASNPERNFRAPLLSVPKYELFAAQQQSFSGLAASVFNGFTLRRDGAEPEQLVALQSTASWIPTVGVTLLHGRNFTVDEDQPGGVPVVILTEECWRTRFGARETIVGETIALGDTPRTVVGVLRGPLPTPVSFVHLLVPRALEGNGGFAPEVLRNGASILQVTARLKPGVTFQQAEAEMQALTQRYQDAFAGNLDGSNRGELRTWIDEQVGNARSTLTVLLTAVALVLLIACANVSNLFLSRLTARHKEIAVRLSLGATRGGLVRQFLLETALFCAGATGLGVLFAVWSLDAAEKLLAGRLPAGTHFALDGLTLGFTVGLSVLSCVVIGLVPALHASRANLAEVLKDSARGSSGGTRGTRLRSGLVVIEVALSVLLLVGSSLLLVSFLKLQSTPPGFDPGGVAAATLGLPGTRYPTSVQRLAFVDHTLDRLRALPQVQHAAAATSVPMGIIGATQTVYAVKGQPVPTANRLPAAFQFIVSEGYFQTLGIPLKSGRAFTPNDRADTPAAVIVNESFAKKLFPGGNALGQMLLIGPRADLPHEIVGIAGDVKSQSLNVPAPDTLYRSLRQFPQAFLSLIAKVGGSPAGSEPGRTEPGRPGDPAALQAILRSAISAEDRTLAIALFQTLEAGLRNTFGFQRIVAWLTGVFAGIALLLSALGLYSVLAYAVTQRTNEIGIRMALGATSRQVLTLVLRHGLKLVAIGLVAGLAIAAGASQLMQKLLFSVQPIDPLIYAAVTVLFTLIATLACLLPARRATKVNPLTALRAE